MLFLSVPQEARALLHLAEEKGEDPEPMAAYLADATIAEARAVVREVYRIRPDLKEAEWYEDFLAAHRALRKARA
jgi:hypothetical protein